MVDMPSWLRFAVVASVYGGLSVWILGGHAIAKWWRNSHTVRWLRWSLADLCAHLAYPFRLLRSGSNTKKDVDK